MDVAIIERKHAIYLRLSSIEKILLVCLFFSFAIVDEPETGSNLKKNDGCGDGVDE